MKKVLMLTIVLVTSQVIAAQDASFLTKAKDSIKNGIDKLVPESENLSQPKLPKKLEKIYDKKNGKKMTEGEKIYAFSEVYIKKVPDTVRKKHLVIPNASKKEWTAENVGDILSANGFIGKYDVQQKMVSEAIVKTALEYNLPFPKTLDQFVYQLFDNISSNSTIALETLDFATYLTNEYLDDVFVDILTNRWDERIKYDHWKHPLSFTRNMCTYSLQKIGTPNTVSKLNCAIQKMVDAGKAGYASEPIYTIDPDEYPVEAKEWLFYHPQPDIRNSLTYAWLKSKWPEKIEISKVNLAKVKRIDKSDPYFFGGGARNKRILIKEVEKHLKTHENARKRWLEDDMSFGINDGAYTDDELWQDYCKDKEKYLQKHSRPRHPFIGGQKRTQKVRKAKPAETAAERQRIKGWQKEGVDSCTFKEKI